MSPHVAIVGPGAVGCMCAAALVRSGHACITLCSRRFIESPVVDFRGSSVHLDLPLITCPAQLEAPVDWLLLTVKAHQTPSAASWLRAVDGPSTRIAVLQNGIEHLDRVRPFAAMSQLLPVVVHCSASIGPTGVSVQGDIRLQVPAGGLAAEFAPLFHGSDITVEQVDDFTTAMWRKLCLNAVTAIMAITRRTAEVYRDPTYATVAESLAAECTNVARAHGAMIHDSYAGELLAYFQSLPPSRGCSILTDRLAGKPLEWDARNGVIQRLGRARGIPTPVTDAIVSDLTKSPGA